MIPRPPPTHEQRKLETQLQLAEEDEVAAHDTLALLWKKVKTHSEWQEHIHRRDQALNLTRAASAKRASEIRKEKAAHLEEVKAEKEKSVAEKSQQRLRVKKDPSVAEQELDMKQRDAQMKRRKKKEPTKEELEAVTKQWVTVGRGGYNISELQSPNYFRAMMGAEKELANEQRQKELEAKKRAVAEIRRNEKFIMEKKAGMTAKYHLPVKKTPGNEENEEEAEEENTNNNADEDDENAGRKPIPGVHGLWLPKFHETVGKQQKRDLKEEKKLLKAKAVKTQKNVQRDIDAAAKLLILHAHMIRKACLEAKETAKKEEEQEQEESKEEE